LGDAKLAGNGHGLAVRIAREELLVGQGQRGDGMKLDACRDLLCVRLRERRPGKPTRQQHDKTNCPHELLP